MIRFIVQQPQSLIYSLSNLRYIGGEKIPGLEKVDAQHLAFFVRPEYRSRNFKNKTDIFVAKELYEFMELVLKQHGSKAWYAAPSTDNVPINKFYQNLVGTYKAQGDQLNYWIKDLI